MTKKFDKLSPGPGIGYVGTFGASDWNWIEREYGNPLPDRARDLISLATEYLTLSFPVEESAPRIGGDDDILEEIRQFTKQAKRIRDKLYSRHLWTEDSLTDEQQRTPLHLKLAAQLEGIISDDVHDVPDAFRITLIGIIEIGGKLLYRASERAYVIRQGDAWSLWLVWLTLIVEAFDLPPGTRRDVYRDIKLEPSQFVKLVKALHSIACPNYHKSATDGGLAKAIERVRSNRKVPDRFYVGNSVDLNRVEEDIRAAMPVRLKRVDVTPPVHS
jgi:hypothetical protein